MHYPPHLLKLINVLKRLPGVGSKSAERFAFHLIEWQRSHLDEFSSTIKEIPHLLKQCEECGCLADVDKCSFCSPHRAEKGVMCVIATSREVFSIEDTGEYRGLYHVLGNLLSPLDGVGPEQLKLDRLKQRIEKHAIKELVIALDSTLEGDATALYIRQIFEDASLTVSRLAFGLPMGSSLDYVDGGTLARAFSGRGKF